MIPERQRALTLVGDGVLSLRGETGKIAAHPLLISPSMHNVRLLIPLFASLALLAGCATPSRPVVTAAIGEAPRAQPAIDWPAVRATLAANLGALPGTAVQVRADGSLLVRIPAAEGFAPNQTEPRPMLASTLLGLIPVLQAEQLTAIQVIGHTDSMGSELHNLSLSIARAEAVVEFLRRQGIALLRLSADGRGESEPIADNDSPAGRAANRRIELILRPLY